MKIKLKQFIAQSILLFCMINATGCAISDSKNTSNSNMTELENQSSHHYRLKDESKVASFNKKIIAIGAGTILVIGVAVLILGNIALNELAHGVAANNAH